MGEPAHCDHRLGLGQFRTERLPDDFDDLLIRVQHVGVQLMQALAAKGLHASRHVRLGVVDTYTCETPAKKAKHVRQGH